MIPLLVTTISLLGGTELRLETLTLSVSSWTGTSNPFIRVEVSMPFSKPPADLVAVGTGRN